MNSIHKLAAKLALQPVDTGNAVARHDPNSILAIMRAKLIWYTKFTLLLTAIWIVFSERIDIQTVVIGVIASAAAIFATNRLVLKDSYGTLYRVRLFPIIHYAVRLLIAIYVAGFQALVRMLSGRINVGIVDITTDLKHPFAISLLANSITLTPGTVTLSQEDQRLKVIWLDCHTQDPDIAGPEIKGPFEELLRGAIR